MHMYMAIPIWPLSSHHHLSHLSLIMPFFLWFSFFPIISHFALVPPQPCIAISYIYIFNFFAFFFCVFSVMPFPTSATSPYIYPLLCHVIGLIWLWRIFFLIAYLDTYFVCENSFFSLLSTYGKYVHIYMKFVLCMEKE